MPADAQKQRAPALPRAGDPVYRLVSEMLALVEGNMQRDAHGKIMLEPAAGRFGRLEVICYAGRDLGRRALWWCRCDCSAVIKCAGSALRQGRKLSCGCLRREKARRNLPNFGGDFGGDASHVAALGAAGISFA